MKEIFLFLIIFLLINLSKQDAPKCITIKNTYAGLKSKYVDPGWTDNTKFVDWWFLYQLKPNGGAIYTDSYLETDRVINEIHGYNVRNEKIPSPLRNTFLQALEKVTTGGVETPKFKSIAYNEQMTDKKENKGAHSKGFFIWNEEGGVHVIHSFPRTPNLAATKTADFKVFKSPSSNDHSQHSICISLTVEQLNIIPKFIITGELRVMFMDGIFIQSSTNFRNLKAGQIAGSNTEEFDSTQLPSNTKFTNFVALDQFINDNLFVNGVWDRVVKINKWSAITSKVSDNDISSLSTTNIPGENTNCHYNSIMQHGENGRYFIQTTNDNLRISRSEKILIAQSLKYFFLAEYIHQYQGDSTLNYNTIDWISQTETKNFKDEKNIMTPRRFGEKLQHIQYFGTPWVLRDIYIGIDTDTSGLSKYQASSNDHSKLLYGTSADENIGVFCFGDLNWQGVQESRGGGFYCNKNMLYLVQYFKRHVTVMKDVEPITKKFVNNLVKPYGIVNLPLNFLNIKKTLELATISRVLNFEIKVKTPVQASDVYMSFSPKVIVINGKEKENPEFFEDGSFKLNPISQSIDPFRYNVGYESVYAPLLVKEVSPSTNGVIPFTSERFSFNVFISPNEAPGSFLMCSNDNVNCEYDSSEQFLLFNNMRVVGNLKPRELDEKEIIWGAATFDPKLDHVNTIPTVLTDNLKIKLQLVNNIENVMVKFSTNVATKKLKFVQTKKILEHFKYDRFSESGVVNPDCFDGNTNQNSIIINYHPECFDQLIYCFNQIENSNKLTITIKSETTFYESIRKFISDSNLVLTGEKFCQSGAGDLNERPKKKK